MWSILLLKYHKKGVNQIGMWQISKIDSVLQKFSLKKFTFVRFL